MDTSAIREAAQNFERELKLASLDDPDINALLETMRYLIDAAKKGLIVEPIDWRDVPGGWSFQEGGLRKYRSLEEAYYEFKIQLTGAESPVMKRVRQKMCRDSET